MDNLQLQKAIEVLQRQVKILEQRRIYRRDVAPSEIKQIAIDGIIIFRGATANKPTNGSTEVQAFYDETVKKLYLWNTANKAWEYVQFA